MPWSSIGFIVDCRGQIREGGLSQGTLQSTRYGKPQLSSEQALSFTRGPSEFQFSARKLAENLDYGLSWPRSKPSTDRLPTVSGEDSDIRIGGMTNTSATKEKASAGDPISPKCAVIEVHVEELKQLFDAIDPSPFRD